MVRYVIDFLLKQVDLGETHLCELRFVVVNHILSELLIGIKSVLVPSCHIHKLVRKDLSDFSTPRGSVSFDLPLI